MGLAASQVRLLQLTSRQHRIEYQAQKIQAQKLQLSNESDTVYNNYMRALDAKKVQYKYVETDGTVSYKDATFNAMFSGYNADIQNQYALQILNGEDAGKFYVTQAMRDGIGVYTETDKTNKTNAYKQSIDFYIDNVQQDGQYDINKFKTMIGQISQGLVADAYFDSYTPTVDNPIFGNDIDQTNFGTNTTDFNEFNNNTFEYQQKYFMKYILGVSENTELTSQNVNELGAIYYNKIYAAKMMGEDLSYMSDTNKPWESPTLQFIADNSSSDEFKYYEQLSSVIQSGNGVVIFDNSYADDYEWLTNMLANGEVMLHKFDPEAGDDFSGAWTEVAVATDLMLQEVADEKELKKAEAVYEAENARINRKDAQYDTLLSQTETERNAIKTEMESLKTVRNENIEKTFKLFS